MILNSDASSPDDKLKKKFKYLVLEVLIFQYQSTHHYLQVTWSLWVNGKLEHKLKSIYAMHVI